MLSIRQIRQSARFTWAAKRARERRASWKRISITLTVKAREIIDYVRDIQESSASLAIDHLILRTEPQEPRLKEVNGIMILDTEDDGPPITLEDVQVLMNEEFAYPRRMQKPTPRRTSVVLSSEAIAIVKRFREVQGVSVSKAISKLIEKTNESTN
jgi:hypothetical protein